MRLASLHWFLITLDFFQSRGVTHALLPSRHQWDDIISDVFCSPVNRNHGGLDDARIGDALRYTSIGNQDRLGKDGTKRGMFLMISR